MRPALSFILPFSFPALRNVTEKKNITVSFVSAKAKVHLLSSKGFQQLAAGQADQRFAETTDKPQGVFQIEVLPVDADGIFYRVIA